MKGMTKSSVTDYDFVLPENCMRIRLWIVLLDDRQAPLAEDDGRTPRQGRIQHFGHIPFDITGRANFHDPRIVHMWAISRPIRCSRVSLSVLGFGGYFLMNEWFDRPTVVARIHAIPRGGSVRRTGPTPC